MSKSVFEIQAEWDRQKRHKQINRGSSGSPTANRRSATSAHAFSIVPASARCSSYANSQSQSTASIGSTYSYLTTLSTPQSICYPPYSYSSRALSITFPSPLSTPAPDSTTPTPSYLSQSSLPQPSFSFTFLPPLS